MTSPAFPELSLRDPAGREVVAGFRPAAPADVPALEALVACSARGLSRGDYSGAQVEAALGSALGVDTQLVRFAAAELMATLPGVRLYRTFGYRAGAPVQHALPGGDTIQFVPMRKELC